MQEIKVSVIIPVYNASAYLRHCLDSVVAQTLNTIEIICVDDGSNDDSLAILQEYAKRDRRIRVICQKNQYAGIARNNGMAIAQGEYLYFMDADDVCDVTMLEKCYRQAKKYEADIVLCSYRLLEGEDTEGKDLPSLLATPVLKGIETFNKYSLSNDLYQIIRPHPWDKLFRSQFVKESGILFQGERTNNDVYFVLVLLALAEKIAYVDEKLYYYRVASSGSLQKTKHKAPKSFLNAYRGVFDELNKRGIYEVVKKSFIERALKGIIFNFSTIWDEDARGIVREELVYNFFPHTRILSYGREFYRDKDLYEQVCNIGSEFFETLSNADYKIFATKVIDLEQELKECWDRRAEIWNLLHEANAGRKRNWEALQEHRHLVRQQREEISALKKQIEALKKENEAVKKS